MGVHAMMKTEYPSRKIVEEYEATFPDEGRILQMHITTDGTTLSQDEIDDLCRKLIESRKYGEWRTMTAEEIDALCGPHTTRSAKEFLDSMDAQDD